MPADTDYPPDGQKAVTVKQMFDLARKLRTKAYWSDAGSDASDESRSRVAALSEALSSVADQIDETFDFSSVLNSADIHGW